MTDIADTTEAEVREYEEVRALAKYAQVIALHQGKPTVDLHDSIFIDRARMQGCSLLITAARICMACPTAPEDRLLALADKLYRLHADDHEARWRLWHEVWQLADREEADAAERADGGEI